MENGSVYGTYIAYGFVVFFLLVVCVAAARSYSMILSLIALAFMPKKREDYEADAAKQAAQFRNVSPE